jgi:hypothetical protein
MPCNFGGIIGFWRSESGAVSVDWVVLSASIVGIGLAAVVSVKTGAANFGAEISHGLSSASVAGLGGNDFSGVAGISETASVARYTPLVATSDELETLVQQLAAANDPATLAQSYARYAQQTAEMLAAGDFQGAPGFLDTVSAFEQALLRTGGTVPQGTPTVLELRTVYDRSTS